jgi:hypothetical protein
MKICTGRNLPRLVNYKYSPFFLSKSLVFFRNITRSNLASAIAKSHSSRQQDNRVARGSVKRNPSPGSRSQITPAAGGGVQSQKKNHWLLLTFGRAADADHGPPRTSPWRSFPDLKSQATSNQRVGFCLESTRYQALGSCFFCFLGHEHF